MLPSDFRFDEEITSPANPRIKSWSHLRDRPERRESGLLIVEGHDELALALASALEVQALLVCPEHLRPGEGGIAELAKENGAEIIKVTRQVMEKVAYREHPDGWLAIARYPDTTLTHFAKRIDTRKLDPLLVKGDPDLLLVVESVEKPGNLGAMLRSADAAGAHGLLSVDGRTDLGNPNVVRSSKGSIFAFPVAEASGVESLAWLKQRGTKILAATPEAGHECWDIDLRGPIAISVGEERHGHSDAWLAGVDGIITIPMFGRVNSLNVAQAATLLLYEARRQRLH